MVEQPTQLPIVSMEVVMPTRLLLVQFSVHNRISSITFNIPTFTSKITLRFWI